MFKRFFALFISLSLCVGAVLADDFEDAGDAYRRQDFATAAKMFQIAASRGNIRAQYNLGFMYDEGKGVIQDYVEAVRWYKMAALQGHIAAQINLGLMYSEGRGVVKNYKESVRWYKLASQQGDSDAQYNLGRNYYFGQGVKQDLIRAHMWTNLAAMSGDQATIENRDRISEKMTSLQIIEAQKLARECQARNFKNCD